MALRQVILAVVTVTMTAGVPATTPVVHTTTGIVTGKTVTALDKLVDAYLGIPYALPPIKDLRFRRPVPMPPWSGVYDATTKPPTCYQFLPKLRYYAPNPENMTEDCLQLSVWVPRSSGSNTKPKTIMVSIHGGAFLIGSSNLDVFDGAVLAAYGDVIVATLNYRVGTLGFFFANVEGARGNMGFHDQVLALKWIKENAENFGGDRNSITLFGESSGASSVAAHLMSPLSQDLFARGIMESGTGMHPAMADAPRTLLQLSSDIAGAARCTSANVTLITNPYEVTGCLRSLPVDKIISAQALAQMSRTISFYPLFDDDFLPKDVPDLIREHPRNKEILIGINKDEGSYFIVELFEDYFGTDGHDVADGFSKAFAKSFVKEFFKRVGEPNHRQLTDYYMSRNKDNVLKAMYDPVGDYLVSCGALFYADLYSEGKNNTYFYIYDHVPSVGPTAEWMGATHFQEVQFVFGKPLRKESNYTEEEKVFSRHIMDRWISFAKTGVPDAENELKWPHYSYEYPAYLGLALDETIKMHPYHGRCEIWRERFKAKLGCRTSGAHAKRSYDEYDESLDTSSSSSANNFSWLCTLLITASLAFCNLLQLLL